MEWTNIGIPKDIKKKLADLVEYKGETYGDIINKIVDYYKKNKGGQNDTNTKRG